MAAVVLAAGRGERFGAAGPGGKLLAPLEGRPVLAHALEAVAGGLAAGVLEDAVVVAPPGEGPIAELARAAGARTTVNETPGLGLSSSLRRGLAALRSSTGAAVVLLGDQPRVRVDVLAALTRAWREHGARLVRPRYAEAPGRLGHPVLADRSVWRLAQRLEGDAGFGALLQPGSPGVLVLDVAGDNPDVDTPADLHTLEGSSS